MFEIKFIDPEMTYEIRHSILRPNQSIEDCKYSTDYEEGAFHVGAFYEGRLISIASFCIERHPAFPIEKQYRLRAMATLEGYRKLGAGRRVVNFAENIIKERSFQLLWCKARFTAQGYYEKLGFKSHGQVFDYHPIGPHIIMYKRLKYERLIN